jgi:hypothetical protein
MAGPAWDELHRDEEEDLQQRVRAAIAKLNATRSERDRLQAIGLELGMSTPDGSEAARQAARTHRESLHRLSEALRELQEFWDRGRWKSPRS